MKTATFAVFLSHIACTHTANPRISAESRHSEVSERFTLCVKLQVRLSGISAFEFGVLCYTLTKVCISKEADMAGGRPTKYDPKYCEEVIEFMSEGLSLTAFAGHLRVHRGTINEWMANHPEFSEAVKVAQGCRTECLERGLLGSEVGPMVTARIFALKNAAPDEWSDRKEIDHTSSDGSMSAKPLRIEIVGLDEGDE